MQGKYLEKRPFFCQNSRSIYLPQFALDKTSYFRATSQKEGVLSSSEGEKPFFCSPFEFSKN